QYWHSIGHALTRHSGNTITNQVPVTQVVVDNGSATLELALTAFLVALAVGIPVGVLAGRFRDTPMDTGGRLFGIVIYAAPVFFTGFLAQLVFGVKLGWFPTSGRVSPLTEFTLQKPTHFYLIDSLVTGNWAA